ncbi:MAG: D-alanyl-D-alanine carboxypeptidase [Paraglaciecola sp.]|jgi:D-alanyl-D-alanine carboxypeptidase
MQSILDNAASGSIDGVVVYIDKTTSEPTDPASLFKIASLSKLFIGVVATKLANQNNLQMDDSLAMWLPSLAGQIQNSEFRKHKYQTDVGASQWYSRF